LTWASSFVAGQVKEQLGNQAITMPAAGDAGTFGFGDSSMTTDQIKSEFAAHIAGLAPFAGQPLDSGPAAKAYATHFISVHMNESGLTFIERAAALGVTKNAAGQDLPKVMNYANATQFSGTVTAAVKSASKTDSIECWTGSLADGKTAVAADVKSAQAGKTPAAGEKLTLTSSTADCMTKLASDITAGRTSTFLTGNTLVGLLLYGYAFATMGSIAGFAAIGAYIGGVIMLILALLGFRHSAVAKTAKA
jgi:hypothetical protein